MEGRVGEGETGREELVSQEIDAAYTGMVCASPQGRRGLLTGQLRQ